MISLPTTTPPTSNGEEVRVGIEGGRSRNRGGVCPSGEGEDREGPGLLGTQDRGLAPTETEQDKFCPRLFPGHPVVRTSALLQQEAGIQYQVGEPRSLKLHSTALPPPKKKKSPPECWKVTKITVTRFKKGDVLITREPLRGLARFSGLVWGPKRKRN